MTFELLLSLEIFRLAIGSVEIIELFIRSMRFLAVVLLPVLLLLFANEFSFLD